MRKNRLGQASVDAWLESGLLSVAVEVDAGQQLLAVAKGVNQAENQGELDDGINSRCQLGWPFLTNGFVLAKYEPIGTL